MRERAWHGGTMMTTTIIHSSFVVVLHLLPQWAVTGCAAAGAGRVGGAQASSVQSFGSLEPGGGGTGTPATAKIPQGQSGRPAWSVLAKPPPLRDLHWWGRGSDWGG